MASKSEETTPCPDCGEVHEDVGSDNLEEAQVRVNKKYWRLVTGLIASVLIGAFGLGMVQPGLGVAFIAAFGMYFFHLNLRLCENTRAQLEQALYTTQMTPVKAHVGKDEHRGDYL